MKGICEGCGQKTSVHFNKQSKQLLCGGCRVFVNGISADKAFIGRCFKCRRPLLLEKATDSRYCRFCAKIAGLSRNASSKAYTNFVH